MVDPIVAVLFGVLLLGEGNATSPAHWAVLVAAALAATFGVAVLARHHPDAVARAQAHTAERSGQESRSPGHNPSR